MKNLKLLSQTCICMLVALSGTVFVGQVNHWNVWALICSYWLVLTAKNLIDVLMNNDKER